MFKISIRYSKFISLILVMASMSILSAPNISAQDDVGRIRDLAWSPDGKQIAYATHHQLYILPAPISLPPAPPS